jgi:hypothetical protein
VPFYYFTTTPMLTCTHIVYQPLLGRVFFDIFHGLLGFLPYPETQPACTQVRPSFSRIHVAPCGLERLLTL